MVWFWFFARVMTRVRHCLWRVVPVRLVVIVGGVGMFYPRGCGAGPPGVVINLSIYIMLSVSILAV